MKKLSDTMTPRQKQQWIHDECYDAVLRATKTVAFEYDPATGEQVVSPFIAELVAGNYDGRLLSEVMLQDGIIYPDDIEHSVRFREEIKQGKTGEMTVRLLTPKGDYVWFRMSLTPSERGGRPVMVGVLANVDAEMRQREILRYRAEFDIISGIFNKTTFFEETEKMLLSAPDQPRYLLRFDIGRFKIINELYSVSEGDLVLRYVGNIVRELAAAGETYARMGNDVFCMCLNRSEQEVLALIKEIENRVNTYPISFQFVVSAGIVYIEHYDGQPVNILCDRAAMAQQTIKGNYIQRWAFYDPSMSEALNREHYITGCMDRALKEKQFKIYLQPKFDICENRIVGAEALVRWSHPEEGMIMPNEFIPLFERNGFILKMDEYVWEGTCQLLRGWLDRGLQPVPISVNVSRIHLHDPEFCDKLLGLIERYSIPPRLLELEITESAYTECPQTLYGIMEKLHNMGLTFSMDDFGSGYSSLNALKDIPVDVVKIDLNFLRKARRGKDMGRGILRGTIQLVKGIDLPIIAEGVETEEQADFLRSAGCTCAQGYYYAKPMPVECFERLLWPPSEQD